MRRHLLIIVFSLLTGQLFSSMPDYNPLMFFKGVYFPVIKTPAVMKSTVSGHDYLVFIEHSDSLNVAGHYMSLEASHADTLPFRLEATGHNAKLYYNGEKETFRPCVSSMDSLHAEGYARLSVFGTASFRFFLHEIPEFHDYENKRYQDSLFAVTETEGITYATTPGYWSELENEASVNDKIFMMTQAFTEVPLDLKLDVFMPQDDTLRKHPLVMLVHGGAFYFGSKNDKSITRWCRHLASLGYVTASIDYRIGFLPTKASIGRAGYRAVQDTHAAMRFLVSNQEEFGIDTSMLFVGGASAGAITTLNMAFMTNESRPNYTHHGFLQSELGDIDTCGNHIKADFRIKGIIDMWGAMPDTSLIRNHNIPILAFHGDADDIVPYGYDYPFGMAGPLKNMLVDKMFGSSCIVEQSLKLGHNAHLVTFAGYKHSPHLDPNTKALNNNFFIIQDMMTDFFYDIIAPEKPVIAESATDYYITPKPLKTSWKAEGGVILDADDDHVKVVWIDNAPQQSLTASVTMPYGTSFNTTKIIK